MCAFRQPLPPSVLFTTPQPQQLVPTLLHTLHPQCSARCSRGCGNMKTHGHEARRRREERKQKEKNETCGAAAGRWSNQRHRHCADGARESRKSERKEREERNTDKGGQQSALDKRMNTSSARMRQEADCIAAWDKPQKRRRRGEQQGEKRKRHKTTGSRTPPRQMGKSR